MSEPVGKEQQEQQAPTYRHTRYDDIFNGKGQQVFERNVYYTKDEVLCKRLCSFVKEEQGSNVFCCTSPLHSDGDRLCQTHYRAWIQKKKEQEARRQERRQEWFDRECQKEYDRMLENPSSVSFSKEITTDEQRENVMWHMAEAIVNGRDKYANAD